MKFTLFPMNLPLFSMRFIFFPEFQVFFFVSCAFFSSVSRFFSWFQVLFMNFTFFEWISSFFQKFHFSFLMNLLFFFMNIAFFWMSFTYFSRICARPGFEPQTQENIGNLVLAHIFGRCKPILQLKLVKKITHKHLPEFHGFFTNFMSYDQSARFLQGISWLLLTANIFKILAIAHRKKKWSTAAKNYKGKKGNRKNFTAGWNF